MNGLAHTDRVLAVGLQQAWTAGSADVGRGQTPGEALGWKSLKHNAPTAGYVAHRLWRHNN